MADNDNRELMKFLEKQFEGIYKRLDNTPTIDDLDNKIAAAKEDTMRHTGVLIEDVHHKLDVVIEGVMGIKEKMDRDRIENEQAHAKLEKMILLNAADISKLDQRIVKLEGRV